MAGLDAPFGNYCYEVEADADPVIVGDNRVRVQITNHTQRRGQIELGLDMRDDGGRDAAAPAPLAMALAAGQRGKGELRYRLSHEGSYQWRTVVLDGDAPEPVHIGAWQRTRTLPLVQIELVSCRHRASFYPDQAAEPFSVDLRVNLGDQHLDGARLAVTLESAGGGQPVSARTIAPVRRGCHRCVLGNVVLRPGTYRVGAVLHDRNNAVLGQAVTPLDAVPSAANTVRIAHDGTVLVRGQPFFPLGIFGAPVSDFARIRQMGFNVVQNYGLCWWPRERCQAYLDAAHTNGLMVTFSIKDFTTRYGEKPKWYSSERLAPEEQQAIRRYVDWFKAHPALLDWYIADEPELQIASSKVRQAAELVARLDAYHPHSAAFCQSRAVSEYWPFVDVLMPDMYPFPSQPLHRVGAAGRDSIRRCGGKRTCWLIVQSCQLKATYLGNRRGRPNYEEMRCMAWQALVAGVNGLYFYNWNGHRVPAEERPVLRQDLGRVVGEIAPLIPALLAERGTGDFEVEAASGTPEWTCRRTAAATHLFAVNPSREPGTLRVTWAARHAPGTVTDVFSRREQQARTEGLTVTMRPYGVSAYRFAHQPVQRK